jgi:hypothetical protein
MVFPLPELNHCKLNAIPFEYSGRAFIKRLIRRLVERLSDFEGNPLTRNGRGKA